MGNVKCRTLFILPQNWFDVLSCKSPKI